MGFGRVIVRPIPVRAPINRIQIAEASLNMPTGNRMDQHKIRHDQGGRTCRAPQLAGVRPAFVKGLGQAFYREICNSHVDIFPGHVHLQEVGNFVKECVWAAGGVPFLFNTIGAQADDGIAMGLNG